MADMNSCFPLVSVITPCYNGEKWIGRLMESVLSQTYSNIEFIIVNDGSTDNSENIILSYEKSFNDRGYIFKYIRQQNQGLGGAINTALKLFTGDFFCWPDADDYLEVDSVEKRVEFLIKHTEYAVVTSNAYVRKANNQTEFELLVKSGDTFHNDEMQFVYLLEGKGIFCPGCHMVRTSCFLDVNPQREIYPARRGQNWQILLPIYYRYRRYFLNEPLYNYIDNPGSMSKDDNTLERVVLRANEHEEIILNTLEMIERVQSVKLSSEKDYIRLKYIKIKMMAAKDYNDSSLYLEEYYKKKSYGVTCKETFDYYRYRFKFINAIIRKIKKYDK